MKIVILYEPSPDALPWKVFEETTYARRARANAGASAIYRRRLGTIAQKPCETPLIDAGD